MVALHQNVSCLRFTHIGEQNGSSLQQIIRQRKFLASTTCQKPALGELKKTHHDRRYKCVHYQTALSMSSVPIFFFSNLQKWCEAILFEF